MIVVIDYNVGNVQSVCNALQHIGCDAQLSRDPARIRKGGGSGPAGRGGFRVRDGGPGLGGRAGQAGRGRGQAHPGDLRRAPVALRRERRIWPAPGPGTDQRQGRPDPARADCAAHGLEPGGAARRTWISSRAWGRRSTSTSPTRSMPRFRTRRRRSPIRDYGFPLTASVQKGNIYGVQFHPEKSGPQGLQVLRNF